MKTIKKLNLHPGQEIGKVQQQFIMAGSGELVWTGNCFCSKKGHYHTMTASETFEYVDYTQVSLSSVAILSGCAIVIGTGGSGGLLVSGLVGGGIGGLITCVKTGTINYSQRFNCIGVNPITHSALLITSSVTY